MFSLCDVWTGFQIKGQTDKTLSIEEADVDCFEKAAATYKVFNNETGIEDALETNDY